MKVFYIKQNFITLRDNLYVYNEDEREVYLIEGNLIEVPKRFVVRDEGKQERASITRVLKTVLPRFRVVVEGQYEFIIKKGLPLFRSRYSVDGEGVEVKGDFWNMDFEIIHKGQKIATVNKEWVTLGDTYKMTVYDEAWEMVVISFVVAIDRVKEEEYSLLSFFDWM